MNVHAFENNLNMQGESYTVYVKQNSDKLMADILCHYKINGVGDQIENIQSKRNY